MSYVVCPALHLKGRSLDEKSAGDESIDIVLQKVNDFAKLATLLVNTDISIQAQEITITKKLIVKWNCRSDYDKHCGMAFFCGIETVPPSHLPSDSERHMIKNSKLPSCNHTTKTRIKLLKVSFEEEYKKFNYRAHGDN